MATLSVEAAAVREIPLVQKWSADDTLLGSAVVVAFYLILVLQLLPNYMEHKSAYRLKQVLLLYNTVQIALCSYATFLYTRYIFRHGIIQTRCPTGEDLQIVSNEIWPAFVGKHLDLLDTVFFLLRKKSNQVSFLHVYHHSIMVTWIWFYQMYHPSDHFVVLGLLNSFVHVLMYTYYAIASLGPRYAKFVWWKKYLTTLQVIQFIIILPVLHYQQKMTLCPIHPVFHYFCLFVVVSFILLFLNFYFQSYVLKRTISITNGGEKKNGVHKDGIAKNGVAIQKSD